MKTIGPTGAVGTGRRSYMSDFAKPPSIPAGSLTPLYWPRTRDHLNKVLALDSLDRWYSSTYAAHRLGNTNGSDDGFNLCYGDGSVRRIDCHNPGAPSLNYSPAGPPATAANASMTTRNMFGQSGWGATGSVVPPWPSSPNWYFLWQMLDNSYHLR